MSPPGNGKRISRDHGNLELPGNGNVFALTEVLILHLITSGRYEIYNNVVSTYDNCGLFRLLRLLEF